MYKRIFNYVMAIGFLFGGNSCSTDLHQEVTILVVPTQEPTNTTVLPAITQTSSNIEIDSICEPIIQKFVLADPCKDWDETNRLLVPENPRYRYTPRAEDSQNCNAELTTKVIRILRAEDWWSLIHSKLPYPESAKATTVNEYVYFIEMQIIDQSVDPTTKTPSQSLFWMVFDPDEKTCLIRNFGW
jgi:hypothetical protein